MFSRKSWSLRGSLDTYRGDNDQDPMRFFVVALLLLSSCSQEVNPPTLYHDGKPWWPLAQNLAWIEAEDSHDYEHYFKELSNSGVGLVRIVLVPWHLHERWDALGEYDETRLAELEQTLRMAANYNLSIILALDIYGELRTESRDPREMLWGDNPNNVKNGGPLQSPAAFFTDETARRHYRRRLEHLVDRIGDERALYMWEFWNEVDLTDGFDAAAVCMWHAEMASFLKSLDSERYLTTSFADFRTGDCVWRLSDIDVVMIHYHGRDALEQIPLLIEGARRYGKPVLLEEFSWGNTAEADNDDPVGEHLRDGILLARKAGYAAGPMIWWWDSYVERNGLYYVYAEDAR